MVGKELKEHLQNMVTLLPPSTISHDMVLWCKLLIPSVDMSKLHHHHIPHFPWPEDSAKTVSLEVNREQCLSG